MEITERLRRAAARSANPACRARRPVAVATLVVGLAMSLSARAETSGPACNAPIDLIRLANPLPRVAQKLMSTDPLTIVAMGSSSTAGVGASSQASNYPNRLAKELRQHFPNRAISVLNRGTNGEEVDDMLKRFDSAVIAPKPDLVLWQFGTNSVIRDHEFTYHGASIHDGVKKIRAIGADIVLIDLQFVPQVIAKPEAKHTVELIARIAKQEHVDLFRRFDVMKRWREVDHMAFKTFVSSDGLHLNDWGYACMAKTIGLAIAEAAYRSVNQQPRIGSWYLRRSTIRAD